MNISKTTKRIIVKIGSALLIDKNGKLRKDWVNSVCDDINKLHGDGIEIAIVSSGSIALGKDALNVGNRPLQLEEKQAAAACGQLALINAYQDGFKKYEILSAQILLTLEDSENRRRYLNARNTIETLFKAGIIPIINENDTVATNEIRFGDNDRLGARIAQMVGADYLILLSDVDGLYTSNPHSNKDAQHLDEVNNIDEEIENMADGISSNIGSGGMKTKIIAAKIAASSGCKTIITLGTNNNPIKNLINGAKHTIFNTTDNPQNARKSWIEHSLKPLGEITIDEGAQNALQNGKSLLPAGVTEVSGTFDRGDAVIVRNISGKEIARGIVAYNITDAKQIVGRKTSEIEEILNYYGRVEMIHRSDLVMI